MTSFLVAAPTLYRFLYSTGVRIGEASAIKNEDVDLEKNIVTQKNEKQEALVNPSLKIVLKDYISYRNKMPIADIGKSDKLFFVNYTGKSFTEAGVLVWFQEILRSCKIL